MARPIRIEPVDYTSTQHNQQTKPIRIIIPSTGSLYSQEYAMNSELKTFVETITLTL